MPLITEETPDRWDRLEELVTAILSECGMEATRQVSLQLPRGAVDIDVLAEETVQGIHHRIICECKNWRTNVPREVVHAFRTVMQETGAHQGYIVSRVGFQIGAIEAARSTNIELLTFAEFQSAFFAKWFNKRLWAMEEEIGNFNTYYEPIGTPGYGLLRDATERAAYDGVLARYAFAGGMLAPFSPYLRMAREYPIPALPFDVSQFEEGGVVIPDDIKNARGYREFFQLLVQYAKEGLVALRTVNPITRGKSAENIERDD